MSKLVKATIILEVGSLQFMEAAGPYVFGKSTFFWKFRSSNTYYGPFNTLLEAGNNVDLMMAMPVSESQLEANSQNPSSNALTNEENLNNLITVDFINKRRI